MNSRAGVVGLLVLGAWYSLAEAQSPRVNSVGINITEWSGAGGDYTAEKIWADAMRSHRRWGLPYDNNTPVALDTNGWPTVDGSCLVYHGLQTGNNHGTYRLSFDCNNPAGVTIAEDWGGGTVQGKTNSGNRVSCRLVISDTNNNACLLRFQNTSGGVRNVKLMRPVAAGSTNAYGEEVEFTTLVLQAVAPFQLVRYMHWMHLDRPLCDMNWSQRTRWNYAAQHGVNPYGWGQSGPSWESVIKFANAAGKDAWICLPVRATDDYIRNLALLFRNGGADCEPLRPDLKLYLEYGNEIWNSGTYYTQWAWVTNATVTTTNSALRYDGTSDPITLAYRYQGMRTVQISGIFREVFGTAAMMTRIRPVLCHQQNYIDICNRTMTFLDKYYARRDSRSDWPDPHPVNYYLYAFSTSTYFNPAATPPTLTLDNIWSSGGFVASNHFAAIRSSAVIAKMYGLAYVAYEGGQHPNYNGDQTITRQAAVDDRMRAKQAEAQRVFNQLDGELNVLFHLIDKDLSATPGTTDGHFGMLRGDIANTNRPRYQAVLDINATAPDPVTYGSMAPFTRAGADFDLETSWGMSSSLTGSRTLTAQANTYGAAYCFRVPRTGTYALRVQYSTTSSAMLAADVRGLPVGNFQLPNTAGASAQTPPVNMLCDTGKLYAIKLAAVSGAVAIVSVSLSEVVTVQSSAESVRVPEGGTAGFQVCLSAPPASAATVTVVRTSGDANISVVGGSNLVFNSGNWSAWQAVTLAAAADVDSVNGTAILTCGAPEISNATVVAMEADNTLDSDGDGMNDAAEVGAGTNPESSTSCLSMSVAGIEDSQRFVVRWTSVTNRMYSLRATTNLPLGFKQTLRANIQATPPLNVHTDIVEGVSCKFCQVLVE